MRNSDFGGFSTRTCTIDLRFSQKSHIAHFFEAWSQQGRPNVGEGSAKDTFEILCAGTTLEHELRHYHDFLLSYSSVHNFWVRLQVFLNAMPLIQRLLKSDKFNTLVFPLVQWAELSDSSRKKYLAEVLGRETEDAAIWNPAPLTGAHDPNKNPEFTTGEEPGYERHLLLLLQKQMGMIQNVRNGMADDTFPFAFTPRFVFEISAILVQAWAVYRTYGVAEFLFFINQLVDEGTVYAKFAGQLISVFYKRRHILPHEFPVTILAEKIDWDQLSTAITWCLTSASEDGNLAYPEARLGKLLHAISSDFDAIFPETMQPADLLEHLSKKFHTTNTATAIQDGNRKLQAFLDRSNARIQSASMVPKYFQDSIKLFQGVMQDRSRMADRFMKSPASYINLYSYSGDLPSWPQCPVHMEFWNSGYSMTKTDLSRLHGSPRFNLLSRFPEQEHPDAVGDVLFESMFQSGTSIPVESALALRSPRTLVDFLLDPEQTSPIDETAIRNFVKSNFNKNLIRLI